MLTTMLKTIYIRIVKDKQMGRKNKQRRYTKRQIKAHKKELYFSKWCAPGNLVKFRPPRPTNGDLDSGIIAWPTYESYVNHFSRKFYRDPNTFWIPDFEKLVVMVVEVRPPGRNHHVMVKIIIPDRTCWVRRQDLRKRKEQRI